MTSHYPTPALYGSAVHETGWLARILLETVSEIAGKTAGVAGTSPTGSQAERDLGTIIAAAMRAVELLARTWPEDYPAGAVERLILLSPVALIEKASSRHASKLIR